MKDLPLYVNCNENIPAGKLRENRLMLKINYVLGTEKEESGAVEVDVTLSCFETF